MTDHLDLKSIYEQSMQPVMERLTETHLERMRTSAISGAGVSLGVILLLLQTDVESNPLVAALYCSIFAVPAWIAAWQYVESYMFCGKDSYGHFKSAKGFVVAASLATGGLILLLASVVLLVWHMSPIAAMLFLAACLAMAVLVYRHHNAVRVFSDQVKRAGV